MVTHAIAPVIRSIPADQIDPNPWNPNCMDEERFEEYVAEVRRIALYLRLPKPLGDMWLDAGGTDDLFNSFPEDSPLDLAERLRPIAEHGLDKVLGGSIFEFRPTLDYALQVAQWLDCHLKLIAAKEYAWLLADRGLPVELLDRLPCQRTDAGVEVLISPAEWQEVLEDADAHADDDAELSAAVEIGIRLVIQRRGVAQRNRPNMGPAAISR